MTSHLVTIATDSHQTCVKMRAEHCKRQLQMINRLGKIKKDLMEGGIHHPHLIKLSVVHTCKTHPQNRFVVFLF